MQAEKRDRMTGGSPALDGSDRAYLDKIGQATAESGDDDDDDDGNGNESDMGKGGEVKVGSSIDGPRNGREQEETS